VKVALVNPRWTFEGSIYFGCREPHLPIELGYTKALLERDGHEAFVVDAQSEDLGAAALRARIEAIAPDATVVTTAPSYLFWRCAPPELRVPLEALRAMGEAAGTTIAVGPHASTSPGAALRKLGVDVVVLGECEEVVPRIVATPRARWSELTSIAWLDDGGAMVLRGGPSAVDMAALPALAWDDATIARHAHHHHRFDHAPEGPGAELEASRGCPFHCSFCAKDEFRNEYRKRPLPVVLAELDALLAQGVRYVYFVDEIFLADPALLTALAARDVAFGVQLRIDGWSEPMLDLLGQAGCVSIEAGIESLSPAGRSLLNKRCRQTTEQLVQRLLHARRRVPFVQANLLAIGVDEPEAIAAFRERLARDSVWANDPVPLFPYPGSPGYTARWGKPDDDAWERALAHYLEENDRLSDLQADRPRPLAELESALDAAPRGAE
jgi:anaerobic magnesium-protoporphyrin IX monomethyl ester cyclase